VAKAAPAAPKPWRRRVDDRRAVWLRWRTIMADVKTDSRKAAEGRIHELIALLRQQPASAASDTLIEECEALARAIAAFHMEGIRFRMFNVDRTMVKGLVPVPAEAKEIFADARRQLEAAGFQTRSHQAPG
jgi:hypothetical protein